MKTAIVGWLLCVGVPLVVLYLPALWLKWRIEDNDGKDGNRHK